MRPASLRGPRVFAAATIRQTRGVSCRQAPSDRRIFGGAVLKELLVLLDVVRTFDQVTRSSRLRIARLNQNRGAARHAHIIRYETNCTVQVPGERSGRNSARQKLRHASETTTAWLLQKTAYYSQGARVLPPSAVQGGRSVGLLVRFLIFSCGRFWFPVARSRPPASNKARVHLQGPFLHPPSLAQATTSLRIIATLRAQQPTLRPSWLHYRRRRLPTTTSKSRRPTTCSSNMPSHPSWS